MPTDELMGWFSGLKAWAATPPNSARPSGVRNAWASHVAGVAAGMPKRASRSGCAGTCWTGRMMSCISESKWADDEPNTARQARPSRPRPAAVSSIERCMTPAPPPSSGWARSTSGQAHSRPWRSRPSEVSDGAPGAIGCAAEQSSCSRPGRVSSLVRVPPPIVSAASITVTDTPRVASAAAQARPLGPAPTMMAVLTRPA